MSKTKERTVSDTDLRMLQEAVDSGEWLTLHNDEVVDADHLSEVFEIMRVFAELMITRHGPAELRLEVRPAD